MRWFLFIETPHGLACFTITVPVFLGNDFEIAKRHSLAYLNILNKDGTLNEKVPQKYQKLSMKAARKVILQDLDEEKLLIETSYEFKRLS